MHEVYIPLSHIGCIAYENNKDKTMGRITHQNYRESRINNWNKEGGNEVASLEQSVINAEDLTLMIHCGLV